jgi:hypothetical protein
MAGQLKAAGCVLLLWLLSAVTGCRNESSPVSTASPSAAAPKASAENAESILLKIANVNVKKDASGQIIELDCKDCGIDWIDHAEALAKELKSVRSIRVQDDAAVEKIALFPSVRNVYLYRPRITDAGVAHLKNLPELRLVHLNQCSVSDAGCAFLKQLKKLKEFGCYGTPIGQAGLSFIAKPDQITKLNLRGSAITDEELIAVLQKFILLTSLELSETGITDKSVPAIARLPDLVDVNFWLTKITDSGVAQLVDKPLKRLNLDNIPTITNASIESAAKIKTLEFLHLGKTGITDAGLEPLKSLPNLTELHISHTAVTPAAAAELKAAMPKVKIVYDVDA